jgi:uncharacterized protein
MSTKEIILPFFPLNISLLPGEDIPLRIFEPKYKQLINECFEEKRNFGIPFLKNSEMQRFGIECQVKQLVARNSKGEMVIVVEGVINFEVKSIEDPLPGKLYSGGKILPIINDRPVKKEELLKFLMYYTDHFDPDFLKNVKGKDIQINDVARALNLSSEDKFRFISIKEQAKQEQFLNIQLWYLMKLREQEKLLKNDYYLN